MKLKAAEESSRVKGELEEEEEEKEPRLRRDRLQELLDSSVQVSLFLPVFLFKDAFISLCQLLIPPRPHELIEKNKLEESSDKGKMDNK